MSASARTLLTLQAGSLLCTWGLEVGPQIDVGAQNCLSARCFCQVSRKPGQACMPLLRNASTPVPEEQQVCGFSASIHRRKVLLCRQGYPLSRRRNWVCRAPPTMTFQLTVDTGVAPGLCLSPRCLPLRLTAMSWGIYIFRWVESQVLLCHVVLQTPLSQMGA